jgi:hypothetical protein
VRELPLRTRRTTVKLDAHCRTDVSLSTSQEQPLAYAVGCSELIALTVSIR